MLKIRSKLQEIMNQTYSLKMKKEDLARICAEYGRQSASINFEQSDLKPGPQDQQSEQKRF